MPRRRTRPRRPSLAEDQYRDLPSGDAGLLRVCIHYLPLAVGGFLLVRLFAHARAASPVPVTPVETSPLATEVATPAGGGAAVAPAEAAAPGPGTAEEQLAADISNPGLQFGADPSWLN